MTDTQGLRGQAFTVDALLAAMLLSLFLIAFTYLSVQAEEDAYGASILQRQADDVLISLDKAGDLATLNAEEMNNSISQMLPPSLDWHMEVRYYNHSDSFGLASNRTLGNDYSAAHRIASSQREFVVAGNHTVEHYGTARLWLWAK